MSTTNGAITLGEADGSGVSPVALTGILGAARQHVLRATVLICLLISFGNLVGAIAGFTESGRVTGPAVALGTAWCVLWALAAAAPQITARCFTTWRQTAWVLAGANALTVAATGGVDSPLLAVCMYAGWIASVVVLPRAALLMSFVISGSVFAGYVLAGASPADILTGPYRYGAVTNAVLPIFTALVGVLLVAVTNGVLSRLVPTLRGLRAGAPASTPGLTALLAGRPVLEDDHGDSQTDAIEQAARPSRSGRRAVAGAPLTTAERDVLQLLAEGHTPQQIARIRGVDLSTVRSQLKRAKAKTGAKTLAELALHAEL